MEILKVIEQWDGLLIICVGDGNIEGYRAM
jgi:hypothetical protein